jgi:hypothetical protein
VSRPSIRLIPSLGETRLISNLHSVLKATEQRPVGECYCLGLPSLILVVLVVLREDFLARADIEDDGVDHG